MSTRSTHGIVGEWKAAASAREVAGDVARALKDLRLDVSVSGNDLTFTAALARPVEIILIVEVWSTVGTIAQYLRDPDETERIVIHPAQWPDCLDMLLVIEDGLLQAGAKRIHFSLCLSQPWAFWQISRDYKEP